MLLTNQEFITAYNKIVKLFQVNQNQAWAESTYRVRKDYSQRAGIHLYLALYALDTWNNTDGAHNFMSEQQMLTILDKASSTAVQ
jgi:hypothetical protein